MREASKGGTGDRTSSHAFFLCRRTRSLTELIGGQGSQKVRQIGMNVIQINSGEYVGMRILAVTSIPHISILSENPQPQEHTKCYAQGMANLLSEIYQQYKELFKQAGQSQDIAIKLNRLSVAIVNQPYKAKNHLFILLRSIQSVQQWAEETLEVLYGLSKATSDNDKYENEDYSFAEKPNVRLEPIEYRISYKPMSG